jgi:RNA polymerase sigma-70 factor (ECF subfamily)
MPIRAYELDFEALEGRLAAGELRGRLAVALDSVPKAQRDALGLRVVEERPYDEVAAALGCSETAARLRVMRGLARLARLLGQAESA